LNFPPARAICAEPAIRIERRAMSDHPITISPAPGRVTVSWRGKVIARTDRALELREANYPPVLYIPREDAEMAVFARTAKQTTCPYKGVANYFSLAADGAADKDAVWTYETPKPGVS
jgi:uncharacterized protein (DUF427 family)